MEELENIDYIRDRGGVRQHNIITNSHLPYTLNESKLFLCILAGLKPDKYDYTFPVSKIMSMMKLTSNRYTELTSSLEGLYNKSIPIPSLDDNIDDSVRIFDRRKFPIITGEKMEGVVQVSIGRSISPYLFQLKNNFTHYQIQSFLRLSTTHSQKLYTLLSQYKETGILIISFDKLQEVFGVNYKMVGQFKENVLNKSLIEIKKKTNIKSIKLVPTKSGRKITGWRFLFKYEKQLELDIDIKSLSPKPEQGIKNNGERIEKKHQQLIKDYHLTPQQSFRILSHISITDVNKTLYIIQKNKINNMIKGDIGGYTLGVFRKRFNIDF